MTSIDKMVLWDLIHELSPAGICELVDKLAQIKDLFGLDNHEPINEITADENGSTVISPQFPFCSPLDDKATTAITLPADDAPKRARKRPDKPFRLTAEEKFEILERHSFGESQTAIAEVMGRSLLTVGKLIKSHAEKSNGNETA